MRLRSGTVFVILFVTTTLTSCVGGYPSLEPTYTPVPTVVEPGLGYGVPCKPPCWRGIVPGRSTRQEVAQAIEQLRAEGWAYYIADGSSVGGGYSISPSPFTSQGTIDVIMRGDIVTVIHGTTLFYYPIGTLIEQFGGPERVWPLRAYMCSSCEEWEPQTESTVSYPVHLLYPSQGLWFMMLVPESGIGCICPEMRVVSFCYYAPVSLQEALENDYLANLCTSSLKGVTEEDLVEWHGFGGGY